MNVDVVARYRAVRDELSKHCESVGRSPEEVRLVAVSKMVELSVIKEAFRGGSIDFGENRPDGLFEKHEAFSQPRWHFIGNIQSRKIPQIVAASHLIHSVYQPHHLGVLDSAAAQLKKTQGVLIEVNVSGEATKAGLRPCEVEDFIKMAREYEHIRLEGFMTMAPQGDARHARTCFDSLARLRSDMEACFSGSIGEHDLHELSMGMSEDWRQAIEAGATIVRIGRAIFNDAFSGAA